MSLEIVELFKIVIVTFLFSVAIMFIMKIVAHHIGAVDVPRNVEGNRHIHKRPIPKLGGVGIFLAFLFGYMLFGKHSVRMNAILIGSFIIILSSIVDDVNDLRASQKFLCQLAAALIIVLYGHIVLTDISIFGISINFGIFSNLITIFFIVACINIINLTDGLDGLSGGITSIFYITTAFICFYQTRFGSLEYTLILIMLGATLGFLVHNFYPAKIFAGDASQFMGFMVAIVSLLGFKGTAFTSLFVPLAILAVPILDTLFAIIRRFLKGQPIFSPDKQHLHHQILGMNFSHRTTVLIIYGINILFAIASVLYLLKITKFALLVYVILLIGLIWFVCYTSIITDKRLPKIKNLFTRKK